MTSYILCMNLYLKKNVFKPKSRKHLKDFVFKKFNMIYKFFLNNLFIFIIVIYQHLMVWNFTIYLITIFKLK